MAFDQSAFAPLSAHAADSPSLYSYKTADTIGQVTHGTYFEAKKNQLSPNDFMMIQASNGAGIYEVNADSKGVSEFMASLQKGAFGELITSENTAIIQSAGQHGLGTKTRTLTSGAGATAGTNSDSLFFCSSGTDAAGISAVFSRKAASYKAGQGLVAELTALFGAPVDNNIQQAGMINATDSFSFGYSGVSFGVWHDHHGQQEIQELQVTTPASGSESATVTIDGAGYTVALTNSSAEVNAAEICASLSTEPGLALYAFQAAGDTVVLRTILAITVGGSFAFSSSTAAATWTKIATGIERTRHHIAQADWNGSNVSSWVDFDGSPLPFDPLKGNVYKIQAQYLGFGNVFFYIENPVGDIVLVHTIGYSNRNLVPTVSNPTFRVGWVSANIGSTTDVGIKGGSYSLFIEGKHRITEQGHSSFKAKTGITTAKTNLITILNGEVFGTKVNLASVLPLTVSVETDSTKGAVVEILVNAILGGQPLYEYHNKEESAALIDTSGTTVTGGNSVATIVLGPSADRDINLGQYNTNLNPSDTMTVAITKLGASTHDASASIVWQEDI